MILELHTVHFFVCSFVQYLRLIVACVCWSLLLCTSHSLASESGNRRHAVPSVCVQEDNLCKLGRDVTEALSRTPGRKTEDLPLDVVAEVASLADSDWSVCLERHIDVQRCEPRQTQVAVAHDYSKVHFEVTVAVQTITLLFLSP